MRSCVARAVAFAASFRSRLQSASTRMSLTSELLPEPLTPVTQTNSAERDLDVDVLEVVVRRARRLTSLLAVAAAPRCVGTLDLLSCRRDTARSGCARLATIVVGGADGDDFAAADAGAGAEIDDVVGGPHRVFVVLDDDDRVAQVAQLLERVEQAVVVARVQADRRLVEDVEHADQAAADLAGQADALRFAAGERRGGAVEREVVAGRR